MVMKSVAVTKFLELYARPDLAELYTPDMEVQVNAAQDDGELEVGQNAEGKHWQTWINPNNPMEAPWKSFRMPLHANTDPVPNDSEIRWNMEAHTEGIGLTGWDFKAKVSKYVAFDFDAIAGHSEGHVKKLTDESLDKVQEAACEIPWVTVRKSTSGNGLHLYVFLHDVPTGNHTEHAALARAILGKMSAITGFDFNAKVDNCGGIMWIWHRKYKKNPEQGLKLIKQGEFLEEPPPNWRDHVKVTAGARKKNTPGFVVEKEVDAFEDLCGQHPHVPLDDSHRRLIAFLEESGAVWWWDTDHHMLVTHTFDLKQAHKQLGMKGIFETLASGKEHGTDQNCFLFPMRKGAWSVRRHGEAVAEHESWDQDNGGWTRTYLNREPTLQSAAKTFAGIEDGEKGEYVFKKAVDARKAAEAIGGDFKIPDELTGREAVLKQIKDGRVVVKIKRDSGDPSFAATGWLDKKDYWVRTLRTNQTSLDETGNYDDMVRHIITESGEDSGWVVKSSGWVQEPLKHASLALGALGVAPKEIPGVIGNCVIKNWTLVNKPFQPEYLGDRLWNKYAAQISMPPNSDIDNLSYGWWTKLLTHIGRSLDFEIQRNDWCIQNGILTGGDYLKVWIASMFQKPFEPLPYLFLYGEQGTGKSVLHEAITLLMTKGVVRADIALTSTSSFNGELQSAVLCVVEEVDLSHVRSMAYNRIKDWVTGKTINIHIKGVTPYSAPNTTHWMQMSNDGESFPAFPGDTRLTMIRVDMPDNPIPKRDLMAYLLKEAPDFLASILNMEIPVSNDRLNLPVINTDDKREMQDLNANEFQQFLSEQAYNVDGEMALVAEVFEKFRDWLPKEKWGHWTKQRMTKNLPAPFVKGRVMKYGAKHYIGNIAWEQKASTLPKLVVYQDQIVHEGSK